MFLTRKSTFEDRSAAVAADRQEGSLSLRLARRDWVLAAAAVVTLVCSGVVAAGTPRQPALRRTAPAGNAVSPSAKAPGGR